MFAPKVTPDGRVIDPKTTVMLAVVVPLAEVAVTVADPAVTPVIGTLTEVAPVEKETVVGTVAAPVLLEFKLTLRPPDGAGDDRVKARFCVAPAISVRVFCGKLSEFKTCTTVLAPVKPGADALMLADPKFTAVTCG
jgi:hypothetical protein